MNQKVKSAILSLAILSLSASSFTLHAAEKAVLQSRVAATDQVGFDVYLPLQHRDQLEIDLHNLHDPNSSTYQKWLTPEQFHARYGATSSQLTAIQNQLTTYGLQASIVTPQHIHVTGSATSVEQALGTVLKHGIYPSGKTTIVAAQAISTPSTLSQVNAVVTGLSGTIRMRTHSHPAALPQNRYSATGGYFFDDLKQAYSYPSYKTYTGKGVTIGILMTGDFNPPDMTKYFTHEKLATPSYTTIQIDGGAPFSATGSFETHLDLQQSGGMAPDAKVILYNLPDLSDAHIMDGLSQILADNKADVVSMSFGAPELFYTAAYNDGTDYTYLFQEEDDLMAQGNAQGITFIASSGDSGALSAFPVVCFNGGPDCGSAEASVQFPASSPHVTGVGGTNLITTYTGSTSDLNSTYIREEAYADPLSSDIFYGTSATGSYWGSGGGDSILYKKPLFQGLVNTGNAKFRTVPDLALHMGGCPYGVIGTCNPDDSYDYEVIGDVYEGVIGTSASAPDFAGLTALNIQRQHTRLGNENYYIYTLALLQNIGLPIDVFKTNIPGYNGLYHTTPKGYNRVLGNGTLNGVNFLLAPFTPVAGVPQTPSNP
ncbi:S53 family peptidase [Granulicella arctica]|uniref:Subtilase family serine protease n=1 Tax=Granulicella arctica TaxID=940613 RepID=A0A7Y9TH03_9BACT|nr:S53 family peptidase [Granulicella arctica]NYF80516.1 subtilase family serine protease [Granulicella arctica]